MDRMLRPSGPAGGKPVDSEPEHPATAAATDVAAPAVRAAQAPGGAAAPHVSWSAILVLLLAYVLADSFTEIFPHPRFGVQPWSLHPALALAVVFAGGRRAVPLVLAAVFAAWAMAPGAHLDPAWLPAALAITAVYAWAGSALRRLGQWGRRGVGLHDVHLLLAITLATATLCAVIDGLRQIVEPDMAAGSLPLLTWRLFVAKLLALVVWTPILLQALGRAWWPRAPLLPRAAERLAAGTLARDALLFLVALAGLLYVVFGIAPLESFRMSYLLFLPVTVAAMRYGLAGVAAALPPLQLGLLGALATLGTRPGTAFEFQMLVLTLAISALYLGTLTDERRRAVDRIGAHERSLRERSRALDEAQRIASTAELAAALAHDLSQPLSAIGTYARASQLLAQRGAADHAKLVDTLGEISAETARAGQYLRRMREFFRTGTMRSEKIAVATLFESTHAHLRDRLVRADIAWHTTIEPGLPALRADAVQTGAILGNLVANACDALSGPVALRVIHLRALRAPDAPGMVRILVEDSGHGVAPDIRERLFKPLSTGKPGGMGLGLALSRSIAERQGGRLWFDAGREHTTFCLDLPGDA